MPNAKCQKRLRIRHSAFGIRHSSFDIGPFATRAHVDACRAPTVLCRGGLRSRHELVGAFVHPTVTARIVCA
jgi:hypothetical protein